MGFFNTKVFLTYVPEIIKTRLISKNHNDSLAKYFEIQKIWELIIQKYYWPSFQNLFQKM